MIIDGKKLASEILVKLKKVSLREISRREKIQKLPRRLTVGAVLVGENPASESFLKQKAKVAKILSVNFKIFRFKSNITTIKLAEEIKKLNGSKNINGIIAQLPLPKHINTELILNAINPEKDIDALSKSPIVLAPTVEAVKFIFHKYKINYKKENILIVGRGRLVGKPIFNWLTSQESYREVVMPEKIKIIDVKQKNQLPKLARKADIIISGAGKAGLITGKMINPALKLKGGVKRNSVLIDFGFSQKNGPPNGEVKKINGDFDFKSCFKKAKLITPVPGGMGPIMVAMLFRNLFILNKPRP